MPSLKIENFAGMIPARDPTLLPENAAGYSRNASLYKGNLQGFRQPSLVHTLSNSAAVMAYRVPLGAPYDFANSVWMEFTDPYTNVIRAPVIKDTYKRYYFFSPSNVPQYSPLASIQSNALKLTLGVPAPEQAPAVLPSAPLPSGPVTSTVTTSSTNTSSATGTAGSSSSSATTTTSGSGSTTVGGTTTPTGTGTGTSSATTSTTLPASSTTANISGTGSTTTTVSTPSTPVIETRAYVYTWVTTYGEEGPPSLPTVVTSVAGSTYQVVVIPPLAADTTNRSLGSVNIYRTVTDASGNAEYYLVTTMPITATVFNDTILDSTISTGTILPSLNWTPPPALQGCVAMPNGILAGWANDREIWFCEPYRPHAWPVAYSISVDFSIVGLGVTGSSLVIATTGNPYIATGITPGSMTLQKMSIHEPCISRNSIVSSQEAVYYSSENGLVAINPGMADLISKALVSRQDWAALGPANFCAAKYSSAYLAFTKATTLGDGSGDNGFIIDNSSPNTPYINIRFPTSVTNIFQDEITGEALVISNGAVYQWDAQSATTQLPYLWRSRTFQFLYRQQFVAALIYFTLPTSVKIPAPSSATRNTSQTQTFDPTTQYLIFRVYADGNLVLVREVQKTAELIMIPSGFKANFWQFELEGQVTITNFQVATAVKDLGVV